MLKYRPPKELRALFIVHYAPILLIILAGPLTAIYGVWEMPTNKIATIIAGMLIFLIGDILGKNIQRTTCYGRNFSIREAPPLYLITYSRFWVGLFLLLTFCTINRSDCNTNNDMEYSRRRKIVNKKIWQ